MSSSMLSKLFICLIVLYNLSSVLSDCTSCCILGTGCDTAYKGESGKCCGQGSSAYCCPTSSVCQGMGVCEMLYWGMHLPLFICVILIIVLVCCVILIVCCRLLSNRRPPLETSTVILQPAYQRPDVYRSPTPATTNYNS